METISMLEEEFTSITFSELKHLSDEDLPQCLSKEAAFKICKDSFALCTAPGYEIFSLWTQRIIKIFDGSQYSFMEWQQLTEFFLEIVQQLFSERRQEDSKVSLEDLSSLFADGLELLKWFRPLAAGLSLPICCLVLDFALKTVLAFIQFYRSCSKERDLHQALQDALLMHNFVLQILNENIDSLKVSDDGEFAKLTDLLTTLCSLGEQSSPVDIKTIVETWKCVTKLVVHCTKCFQPVDSIRDMAWITKPLKFLIHEIGRNLSIVYKEETLQQPIEQVEKYLRVTNFYLKLLQRLTSEFRHEAFPCCEEFSKTLALSKLTPKYLQNSEIGKIVEKYVKRGLCETFQMIYKNENISKMVIDPESQQTPKYTNEIAKELLHATIMDRNSNFINENIEVFTKIFAIFLKDLNNITITESYNSIIEMYAALSILNVTRKLKNYFKLALFKDDLILARTSVDILLTIARSSITREEELLQDFRFWRRCNERFSLVSSIPSECHVRLLLRHHYNICKSSNKISKSDLWDEYSSNQLQKSNWRFFMAIGLKNAYDNQESLNKVTVRLSDELFELLQKLETNCTVEVYYKLIVHIKLLATSDTPPKQELLEKSVKLLMHLLETPNTDLQPFSQLFEAVLTFATVHGNILSNTTSLKLLQILLQHAQKLPHSILVTLSCFVNVTSQNPNRKQVSERILLKIASKPETKSLISCFSNEHVEKMGDGKLNHDLYRQLSLQPFPKHRCAEKSSRFEEQPAKRLRMEDNGGNLKIVLDDLLLKSQEIMQSVSVLSERDFNVIKDIASNLSYILRHEKNSNTS